MDESDDLDMEKTKYDIQPMPVYLTIGDQDGWFSRAKVDFHVWAHFNGCSSKDNTTATLTPQKKHNSAIVHSATSCTAYAPALETVLVEVTGAPHVPDERMAKLTWDFLKMYKRVGALAEMPVAVAGVDPPPASSSESGTTVTTAEPDTAPSEQAAASSATGFTTLHMLSWAVLALRLTEL
eukprot:gnl/TRDRNA2_/TRDRNA2_168899_c2_seq2.p1 gnl/TRDRNA2_/TRDRNA2_168899_c2~~gnl/TRDRNA2_/TRDRNA2_168899_c2_seq2.p1  ORF type:complete len:193 (+),score=26.13 gnl/TRDRNA2_/TRDRNA2_168899_c2_seq2:37-579(+)